MGVAFAEGRVTQLRREVKLLVSAAEAARIGSRLREAMGAAAPTPTRLTSVYLDRPGLPLARQARLSPHDCVKVRVREYWPDLDDPERLGRVVLEVKRERGARTSKERMWVPRSRVRQLLAGDDHEGERLSIRDPLLAPAVAVSYERRVFQAHESWRVTVDRRIAFHAASWELVSSDRRTVREALGPPLAEEPRTVIELKHAGDGLPEWIAELAAGARPYSKFVEAVTRLGAGASDGAAGG